MTTIRTNRDYEQALERMNALRNAGSEEAESAELADLEAAVAAYAQQLDKPASTPGKPAPNAERDAANDR
jgi:hypothetical protein